MVASMSVIIVQSVVAKLFYFKCVKIRIFRKNISVFILLLLQKLEFFYFYLSTSTKNVRANPISARKVVYHESQSISIRISPNLRKYVISLNSHLTFETGVSESKIIEGSITAHFRYRRQEDNNYRLKEAISLCVSVGDTSRQSVRGRVFRRSCFPI